MSHITTTSAVITWTIPFIVSTQESYVIFYGLDTTLSLQTAPYNSGVNITIVFSQVLFNLDPLDTYYFKVVATNNVGSAGSDINSFTTLPGGNSLHLTFYHKNND